MKEEMSFLTESEKQLVKELYETFDVTKQGYISARSARHSSKMLELINGLQKHTVDNQEAKVYLEDMMKFYEEFKAEKIRPGREAKEEIMTTFIEMMISRVKTFHRRYSFRCLSPDVKPGATELQGLEEKEMSEREI